MYSNAIVPQVISVYKETFASALPRRAPTYFCERSKEETGEAASYSFQQRSEDVAIRGHICIPIQTAEACCVSAWAIMKCADVYTRHCWAGSCIEATQFYESRTRNHPPTKRHLYFSLKGGTSSQPPGLDFQSLKERT